MLDSFKKYRKLSNFSFVCEIRNRILHIMKKQKPFGVSCLRTRSKNKNQIKIKKNMGSNGALQWVIPQQKTSTRKKLLGLGGALLSWRLIEYFGLPYNRKSSPPYREVSSTLRYRPLLITRELVLIALLLASTTLRQIAE